ncbi:MAG: diphthamide biosynthesis enzyme Dph2 [Desulfurococcaceae archaeon]
MSSLDHYYIVSDICDLYEIAEDNVNVLMEKCPGKSILLHAPDGLKPLYKCIQRILGNVCNVYFSTSPGYGACDIPFEEASAIGADLIIHIGHSRYILGPGFKPFIEIIYLPVYYKVKPPDTILTELDKELGANNAKKLTVSSTVIETRIRNYVVNYLREKGYEVYEIHEPILGCYYSNVMSLDDLVDVHVVISGGLFHPYGLGLISNKKVIAFDPYSWRTWVVNPEIEKIRRKRIFILNKVKYAGVKNVGIVIGSRPGQYRPVLIKYIEELAISAGMNVFKIVSTYVNKESLIAIDNAMNMDAYVVTTCPRLPIDDLYDFHKPVLTPGEFMMIVKNINDKYIYPW